MEHKWLTKDVYYDPYDEGPSRKKSESQLIYFRIHMERRQDIFDDLLKTVYAPFMLEDVPSYQKYAMDFSMYYFHREWEGRVAANEFFETRLHNNYFDTLLTNLECWYERHSLEKLGEFSMDLTLSLVCNARDKGLTTFEARDITADSLGSSWMYMSNPNLWKHLSHLGKFVFTFRLASIMEWADFSQSSPMSEGTPRPARVNTSVESIHEREWPDFSQFPSMSKDIPRPARVNTFVEAPNKYVVQQYAPFDESKYEARDRIKNAFAEELDAYLDKVDRYLELHGFKKESRKRGRRGDVTRHFYYLYHYHMEGCTVKEIIEHYFPDPNVEAISEPAFYKAVKETAVLIGIDLT